MLHHHDIPMNSWKKIHKYLDKPIEQEKLTMILKAGQFAPTAGNFQPQKIYVLQSEEARKTISQITPGLFNAPCALLVCYDANRSWKCPLDGYDSGQDEAAIVTTHMMMEAWELGIGSVWVRAFDGNVVSRVFSLPDNIKVAAMLTLGYPADDSKPGPMHYSSKPLDDIIKFL